MNALLGFTMFGGWFAAYFLMIRKGFIEKTYGMPVPCICLNLTWELTLGFTRPPPDARVQLFSMGWSLIDLVILAQFCRYGKQDFPLDRKWFYPAVVLGLFTGFSIHYTFIVHLGDTFLRYGGLFIQVFMSYTYIGFFFARKSLRGQSLAIAVLRGIGTLCAGLMSYPGEPYYPNYERWVNMCVVAITLLDLAYVLLVYDFDRKARAAAASSGPPRVESAELLGATPTLHESTPERLAGTPG